MGFLVPYAEMANCIRVDEDSPCTSATGISRKPPGQTYSISHEESPALPTVVEKVDKEDEGCVNSDDKDKRNVNKRKLPNKKLLRKLFGGQRQRHKFDERRNC